MLPPRLIRRLILAPLVVVIAVALIVLFPVLAVVTVVFALIGRLAQLSARGRMRSLRLLWFAVVWLAAETAALFVSLGLWIASGFGGRLRTEPFQNRNYAIMRWFLAQVYRSAIYTFGLRIEIEGPPFTAEERLARLARPVIVLSRHAGPGDSILLVHHLLSMYDRRPRVVMKAALQLDPILDVVANRVPNVFIGRRDGGRHLHTEEIERLARGLDQDGALVIFPEGGNWTPGRWRRGIQRLERRTARRSTSARPATGFSPARVHERGRGHPLGDAAGHPPGARGPGRYRTRVTPAAQPPRSLPAWRRGPAFGPATVSTRT